MLPEGDQDAVYIEPQVNQINLGVDRKAVVQYSVPFVVTTTRNDREDYRRLS